MNDKSMMRSAETQRLIQEMLLDIVVSELEKQCGIKAPKVESPSNEVGVPKELQVKTKEERMLEDNVVEKQPKKNALDSLVKWVNSVSFSDVVISLLKTLSEVIRISDDHSQFK